MLERTSPLLLVEDEELLAQSLIRTLSGLRRTERAATVAEARERLDTTPSWLAAVVDIGLPDGSGLDVVRYARQKLPLLPVLILTAREDEPLINEAHVLRASYAVKPFDLGEMRRFVLRAESFEAVPNSVLDESVAELAKECGLTRREAEVVAAAFARRSRREVLATLGVSENTLKSQVKSILRKTGHDSMQALSRALLRDVLTTR
jgi:DNA-binding NarL/FixJ family response regulator